MVAMPLNKDTIPTYIRGAIWVIGFTVSGTIAYMALEHAIDSNGKALAQQERKFEKTEKRLDGIEEDIDELKLHDAQRITREKHIDKNIESIEKSLKYLVDRVRAIPVNPHMPQTYPK